MAKRKGVNPNRGSYTKNVETVFIDVDEEYSDAWRLDEAVDILKNGGIGVIPTDTCYSFVTCLNSRKGVERLLKLKGGGKKPLSVLCKDLSMIGQYTSEVSNLKWVYKLLKATLPGPFTYIMPSSSLVPKMIIDRKHHKLNKWRRKEIGVRMPDDELCSSILDALGEPLLSGSVPQAAEDELGIVFDASCDDGDGDDDWEEEGDDDDGSSHDEDHDYHDVSYHRLHLTELLPWANQVDFVVLNGERGGGTSDQLSTVVDLARGSSPLVVRQGKGQLDPALLFP
jgi:tRNA threonylcarbamoyl adenosine modification protein (Sua5/YciO/YrdC/YwlC family)